MNAAQQRWYFYWRAQVRRGNFLPTDLSYIFVHVYELLNLVELADPTQAASRVKLLWQSYRSQHPQLDNYLPEWGDDLLAVKVNVSAAIDWWKEYIPLHVRLFECVTNVLIQQYAEHGKAIEQLYNLNQLDKHARSCAELDWQTQF